MKDLRRLTIDPSLLHRMPDGSHAGRKQYVVYDETIDEILEGEFGRPGLCLKTSRELLAATSRQLRERERNADIQNLFATRDIAPRVIDIVILNESTLASVVEFVPRAKRGHTRKAREELIPRIESLMEEFGLRNSKGEIQCDEQVENFEGDKFVDFDGFRVYDQGKFQTALERENVQLHT